MYPPTPTRPHTNPHPPTPARTRTPALTNNHNVHNLGNIVTSGSRAMSHNAGFKGYVPMSYRKAKFSKSWIRRWRREFGVSEPKQIHARKVPWAKLADRMRRLWRNALALRSVWHRCFAPCTATYGQPYIWTDQTPCHFTPKEEAKKLLPLAHGVTPLHFACSTGLADVVKLLATKKADLTKLDGRGRGCLQLAANSQGDKQTLSNWLRVISRLLSRPA